MILDGLEPRSVFRFFEAICAIPHGSGNTKAISDYCVRFAEERRLEHYQDALNNVIIIAPAARSAARPIPQSFARSARSPFAAEMVSVILVPVSPSGTGNTFSALMASFWLAILLQPEMTISQYCLPVITFYPAP